MTGVSYDQNYPKVKKYENEIMRTDQSEQI